MLIDKLTWNGRETVEWTLKNGATVKRSWNHSPKCVVLLNDRTGVMVVESVECSGVDNLVVINADGSERIRPKPPTVIGRTHGFAYGGYEPKGLVVVVAAVGEDIACEFDPSKGIFTECSARK